MDEKNKENDKKIEEAEKIIDTEIIPEKKGEVRTIKTKSEKILKTDNNEFEPLDRSEPTPEEPAVITISDSKGQKVLIGGALLDGWSRKVIKRGGKIKKLDGDWKNSEAIVIRLKKE